MRERIVLRIRLLLSVISVNITPTTALTSYHPMTSVSRVADWSAERMSSRIRPFFSVGRLRQVSMSRSTKGRWVRSLRLRSIAIIRQKISSVRTSLETAEFCDRDNRSVDGCFVVVGSTGRISLLSRADMQERRCLTAGIRFGGGLTGLLGGTRPTSYKSSAGRASLIRFYRILGVS